MKVTVFKARLAGRGGTVAPKAHRTDDLGILVDVRANFKPIFLLGMQTAFGLILDLHRKQKSLSTW